MRRTFVKSASTPNANPLGEAAALRWLAEAQAQGGVRTVGVVAASPERLELEFVAEGRPTRESARRFGSALARTHAAGAPWFGCPPPQWSGPRSVGRSRTPLLARSEAPETWGAFFAEHRILHFVRPLVDSRQFSPADGMLFERVAARLADGDLDAPEPALVEASGAPCARLHGDLWAGNVLWEDDPAAATGAVLIDPMAHGGHAESDLALLALFGLPYLDEVCAAYDEASALADGWRRRVGLHQLFPLLVHCTLFGGSYLPQAVGMARRYA